MAFSPFVLLDDNLTDSGDLVSVEVFQQITRNCNYLIDSMPVGSIIPVMVGFGATPVPNENIWHPCDGSIITNPNSALRDQAAPNYQDAGGRYMRGYVSSGSIGAYGGSNVKDLEHNHGGTDVNSQGRNGDTDNDFITVQDHSHDMDMDLSDSQNFEPVHLRVMHYIKIL